MDELKTIFASNLIELRTNAGMTQAELAEKLHYTDKAVSKWERAESLPDVYVLKQIRQIFNVTVDALLNLHNQWTPPQNIGTEKETYSRMFIVLSAISLIWTLCVVEFVIVWILLEQLQWIVFAVAVPLSLIVLLVFNSCWYKGKHNMYIVGALVLSLVLLIYLLLLKYNFWQMFLVLIPAELLVYLAFHIYRPRRPRAAKTGSTAGREEKQSGREKKKKGSL